MTTRLGNDDYKRGKQTLQEKLTKEEIDEKLLGYVEIKDLEVLKTIPLGTEFRYFVFEKEGKKVVKKFRLGGRLINKDNADKYIVLASGFPPKQITWSVQVGNSELFYKQKVEDIIDKNEDDVKELKDENKKLKDEKKELILKYNELVEKYSKLKNSIKK